MTVLGASLSILIVEDNRGDSELAKIALEEAKVDAEVRVVECIAAALESLQCLDTDVVLLDMGLPDAIGLDGLRAIITHAPLTPIILLTGLSDQDNALQSLEHGAADYLVKGDYTPSILARAIHYAIERKNPNSRYSVQHVSTWLPG
ncbi:MAG: DNA-binding response OmpR family regulator [Gammaproteobacteria bacterium]|jgi:DNA-binding response OmpR family regulator